MYSPPARANPKRPWFPAAVVVGVAIRVARAVIDLTEDWRFVLSTPTIASLIRLPIVGFLTWILPGLGHIYMGQRTRGLVLLVTITVTFWTGVAIGGVRATIDPHERKLWFVAQMCTAGNTLTGFALHKYLDSRDSSSSESTVASHWSSAEIGAHYTGVAGLLNLLIIFDALSRVEPVREGGAKKRKPPGSKL